MRAVAIRAEARQKQFFDFRGDSVLEALSLIVRPRPIEPDDFGE